MSMRRRIRRPIVAPRRKASAKAKANIAQASLLRSLHKAGIPGPLVPEMVAGGFSFPRSRHEEVVEGPCAFLVTITDNATTATDLTACAAACLDEELIQTHMGGSASDNPEMAAYIDGATLLVYDATTQSLTVENLRDLVKYATLHHSYGAQGVTYEGLARNIRGGLAIQTEEGNTAGSPILRGGLIPWNGRESVPLRNSLFVDFSRDTFEIYPRVAVNTGANVVCTLLLDGLFFPSSWLARSQRNNLGRVISASQARKQRVSRDRLRR